MPEFLIGDVVNEIHVVNVESLSMLTTGMENAISGGGSGTRVALQAFDVTAGSTQADFEITDNTPLTVALVFVNGNTMPPNTYSFAAPVLTFNDAPGVGYPDVDIQIGILYEYNA